MNPPSLRRLQMKHTTGKGKMTNQLEQKVFEVGIKLQSLPHFKYTLLTILKPAADILSKIDQSPSQVILDAINPLR
jgi:hypothetical protein